MLGEDAVLEEAPAKRQDDPANCQLSADDLPGGLLPVATRNTTTPSPMFEVLI